MKAAAAIRQLWGRLPGEHTPLICCLLFSAFLSSEGKGIAPPQNIIPDWLGKEWIHRAITTALPRLFPAPLP